MRETRELGQIEEGDSSIQLVFAEALEACGKKEDARVAIAQARDNLLARAAGIADPELRASLLERVEDNARILRLAAEWKC